MSRHSEELKVLQGKIDELFQLQADLESKGQEYDKFSDLVYEISTYLNGEGAGLSYAEKLIDELVEKKATF